MKPRERLIATVRTKPRDRVPLMLEVLQFAGRQEIDVLDDDARRQFAHSILDQTHYFIACPTGTSRFLVTPPRFIREVSRTESKGHMELRQEIQTPKDPCRRCRRHERHN